jgi:hypothetical protein
LKYRYTILFFVLASLISWILMAGMSIRAYFSLLFALFAIQIFLNFLLETYLGSKLKAKYFTIIIAPGTVIHEMSHALVAKALGCDITKISFFTGGKKSVLGFVQYTQPADRVKGIRSLLISFAPFFGCGVFLIAILNYLALNYPGLEQITPGMVDPGSLGGVVQTAGLIITRFYEQLLYLDISNILILFLLYLEFSFALGSAPSLQDISGAANSIFEYKLEALSIFMLLASVLLIVEYGPTLDAQFMLFSQAVVTALKWFILILMISTLMLFVAVPLSYLFVETAEIRGIVKVIPPLLFFIVYICLVKYLGTDILISLITSMGAYLLALLVIGHPRYFFREG